MPVSQQWIESDDAASRDVGVFRRGEKLDAFSVSDAGAADNSPK